MTLCSDAGRSDELLRCFSSLEIASESGSRMAEPGPWPNSPASPGPEHLSRPSVDTFHSPTSSKALSDVIAALRKLREGVVASERADDFAVQTYLFCIRLSVLVKQPESYYPAILHLLRTIHVRQPLTSVELQEVISYPILDTACRRRQLAEAFLLRRHYGLRDSKVEAVLAALVHDKFVAFCRVKRAVDGHRARIMEWAEADLRTHALKCIGKTYLEADVEFVERMTGSTWDDLKNKHGVDWELDRRTVTIRRAKRR